MSSQIAPVAKRAHKKSRNGCTQCKRRKVKARLSPIQAYSGQQQLTMDSVTRDGLYAEIVISIIQILKNVISLVNQRTQHLMKLLSRQRALRENY